jgi:HlyD family secretion protein
MKVGTMTQTLGTQTLATKTLATKTLGLAAAIVLTLGLGLASCAKKPIPPVDERVGARSVTVSSVEARQMGGGVDAPGVLISREEAAVNSELSGYAVARVYVEAGALVRQGQPLAQLDDSLLQSQIAQQTALVAQQKVAADQAAQQSDDVAGLDNQGVLSKEQIDQRRFQARSARAALDAQTAQLKDLQTREAKMVVRAPVGGLVLQRNVRPGDIAAPSGTPMFTMARDDLIELQADVAEGEMSGIKAGDQVQVALPDGEKVEGTVRLVLPAVDQTTKLGQIRVSLPVRADLRPGGFGRASFNGSSQAVPAVPETAVRYDADGASVMVVDSTNHVHQVPISTGQHAGGYVQLTKGPPVGSRVLHGAAVFVLPGDMVIPVQDGPVQDGAGAQGAR